MRQNPSKRKLPRKPLAASDPGPQVDGRAVTEAGDLVDSAEEKPAQAPDGANRRGPKPDRQPSERSYAVGYGRPPKHSQFKPGRSGNPKGRAPQSRNFKTIVKQVLGEQVQIRESGKILKMPKIEAFVRTLMGRAFKGDPKAIVSFITLVKDSGYAIDTGESGPELLAGWTRRQS